MSGYVSPFHIEEEADHLRRAGFASISEQKAHAARLASVFAAADANRAADAAFLANTEARSALAASAPTPEQARLVAAALDAAAALPNSTSSFSALRRHLYVARFAAKNEVGPVTLADWEREYGIAAPEPQPDRAAILAHAAKLPPAKRARYLASKGVAP